MGRGAASLPVQRVRVGDGQGGRIDTVRVQPGRAWRKGADSGSPLQTPCQLEEMQPQGLGREVSRGTV